MSINNVIYYNEIPLTVVALIQKLLFDRMYDKH